MTSQVVFTRWYPLPQAQENRYMPEQSIYVSIDEVRCAQRERRPAPRRDRLEQRQLLGNQYMGTPSCSP
jgi:hypothetical protein